ncbi:MAG TPA: hypothetical protein PL017_13025 [Tenuifilaceae bacterium]|nr:hypothetical protein [Tenuifilaceae bacterium]HPE18229.1 hypothetical protein [Tenuifilaceae bacterium]HPJ47013.1 hypothetical protein [Tenuifilaceae bacterium]HPQ35514.1 hypothetical protein [Tenuifilaceae bacterium]HRX69429.1 hypothetical protein [Tenuifilaceae bacterium]
MRTIRFFAAGLTLLLFSSLSFGQLVRDLPLLYQPNYVSQQDDSTEFRPWHRFTPGETSYSFEVGAGYSSLGNNMGFSNSYVSPIVSYSATENFQITVGGRFSRTNFNNMNMINFNGGNVEGQLNSGVPTEAFAYGQYIINDKLSVYGYGAFGKNQTYFSPFNSAGFSTADYQQYSFGMNYRLNEKVSFGASFGITNGPAFGYSQFGYGNRNYFSPFFP